MGINGPYHCVINRGGESVNALENSQPHRTIITSLECRELFKGK